jgi:hypothetical protein
MKCIYCLQESGVTFRGAEHVLQQAFGTFGSNTPTLNCVCDVCNNYFGREIDQLLARETLEGVFRYTRGRLSSESRRQTRLGITLAESPEAGGFVGLKVDVDGTTGRLMRPRAQFHVFNFKTGNNEIYFAEQILGLVLPEEAYGKPGKDGVKGTWRVKTFAASKEEHDELVVALKAAGIEYQAGDPFTPPEVDGDTDKEFTLPVNVEGVMDKLHKRALAKIFMNFVAWTLGRDEALNPRWDFLRGYARRAEGEIKARITHEPFWNGQETPTRRFVDNSIDIRIENLGGNVVGSIRFYTRISYQMILAEGGTLPTGAEIGYRFTPGSEPIRGEKRPVGSPPPK